MTEVCCFCGNTLDINCCMTGTASLKQHLFAVPRCLFPDIFNGCRMSLCAQEVDMWRFTAESALFKHTQGLRLNHELVERETNNLFA